MCVDIESDKYETLEKTTIRKGRNIEEELLLQKWKSSSSFHSNLPLLRHFTDWSPLRKELLLHNWKSYSSFSLKFATFELFDRLVSVKKRIVASKLKILQQFFTQICHYWVIFDRLMHMESEGHWIFPLKPGGCINSFVFSDWKIICVKIAKC